MKKILNPPDYVFLGLIGALVLFGLIALADASSVISYEKFGSSFYLIRHQLVYGLVPGLIFFAIAIKISPATWRKLALPLLACTLILLVLVIIPGVGQKLGGSRSWFNIGSISFQPSELAKLSLIIYLGAWFAARKDFLHDFKSGFLPFAIVTGLVAVLLILQPDIGTLAIIGALVLFLAFAAGMRILHLGAALVAGLGFLWLMIKVAPYRTARIASFIHPELDPQGIGYHISQALLAIGSGGLFGVGFGHSRQKFRYLPEVTGDSIFPIIAEELGFIVSAGLIILLMVALWRMFRIAFAAPDSFSRFVVIGIAGWFGIQSFVNIGSMVGVLPLTGLPLPFISYGGTALAVELAAVGIVGAISRQQK